jgi:hypothetical protein
MMRTQLILLHDCSVGLVAAIERDGPLLCASTAAGSVYLKKPPAIAPETGSAPLPRESIQAIDHGLVLSCEYDDITSWDSIQLELQQVAVAIQLVKPSRLFLEYWLQLDESGEPEFADTCVRDLGILMGPEPCLLYQMHNVIEEVDVRRGLGFLSNLAKALDRSQGSWEHPLLAIHRAVVFFCQGYTVKPDDSIQFLWTAGLDCLYTSKLDRNKQGSKEICARIEKLLGAATIPYDAVQLPPNQRERGRLPVTTVAPDIFKLRNAFAHGNPIPDGGCLSARVAELESGYAYQLLEQTEILLRLSLLKILEDQVLFETFSDAHKLDAYFV